MTSSAYWVRSDARSVNPTNPCSEAHVGQEVDIVHVGLADVNVALYVAPERSVVEPLPYQ